MVIDQQQQDVGLLDQVFQVVQRKRHLVFGHVGVAHDDLTNALADEVLDDVHRGRLAHVVDVGLEGDAQATDHRIFEALRLRAHLVDHPLRLGVIDFARGADEARLFGGAGNDEPGVDGDAMPADAGARL